MVTGRFYFPDFVSLFPSSFSRRACPPCFGRRFVAGDRNGGLARRLNEIQSILYDSNFFNSASSAANCCFVCSIKCGGALAR
jgi:hypothetical protein